MTKENVPKTKIFFAHSAGPQYGHGKGSYDLVKYLKTELPEKFQILFPIIERPNAPTYDKFKKLFMLAFAKLICLFVFVCVCFTRPRVFDQQQGHDTNRMLRFGLEE